MEDGIDKSPKVLCNIGGFNYQNSQKIADHVEFDYNSFNEQENFADFYANPLEEMDSFKGKKLFNNF